MDFLARSATAESAQDAVAQLVSGFAGFPVKAIVFFASSFYDNTEIAPLMLGAFPGAKVFGCSSYAEIAGNGIHFNSITAMAFSESALDDFAIAVVEDMCVDHSSLGKAFSSLERQLGRKMMDLDYKKYFGITLFDGAAPGIENFLERIGNLCDITFIGGYASDDFSFANVRVYYDGKTYTNAAILAVLKPRHGFKLLKTQSALPTDHSFLVTGADEANKIIHTLDNRPAVEVYAEAMGLTTDQLTDKIFLYNSFALMADGKPFIRTIRRPTGDGGVQLFCAVKEGLRLRFMKPSDVVESTRRDLAEARKEIGKIRAVLDFDCAHRAMMLADVDRYADYIKLFDGMETAGFSTYGEVYIGFINQTSVFALFE